MAALKGSYRDALEQSIKELYEDRIKFDKLELSQEDLINLFIKPEHRDAVRVTRDLYPWSGGHYSTVRVQVPDKLVMSIGQSSSPPPVLFPVYDRQNYNQPRVVVQEDITPDLWERFNNFVQSQIIMYNQYTLVFQVMRKLDIICASPSQMRFFWPAIEVLAAHAAERDKKDTLVKAVMANSKAPVPRISPTLRQACQDTSAVITAQQMLGKSQLPDLHTRPVWGKLNAEVTSSNALRSQFFEDL